MNTKKILRIVTLLLMVLIAACEAIQKIENSSSEDTEINDTELQSVINEDAIEDEEEDPLLGNDELPMESEILTTNQNALELIEIDSIDKRNIIDIAWSPDGNTLAMLSPRGVDLVNTLTHEETHLKMDKRMYFNYGQLITFSPDGSLLAVSYGKGVIIYDLETQEKLFTLEDFNDMGTFGIAFNHNNSWLATGWGNPWGAPGGLKIWNVSTGTLSQDLSGENNNDSIFDIAFNKDGDLMAGISGEGRAYIRDSETHQIVQEFQAIGGYGYAVAFTPDSTILAVGGAATSDDATACLRLFDLETEAVLFDLQGHENCIESITFDADGGVLASASIDSIRLWDTQNGEQLANMAVPDIWDAHSVAFSPDGTLLATAGYGDVLRLWSVSKPSADTKGSAPDTTIKTSTIQASAFGEDFKPGQWSPNGRFVFFSDQGPADEPGADQAIQTLTFLDTQSGETCVGLEEIINLSYNPWAEEKIPEGPLIKQRAFWMNDNRLLYLSPEGELLAITPCSNSFEDLTTALPESITAFYYGENFDHSQLLLKGETSTWLFTPSTGQSIKAAIPESTPDEEIHFAWSPWESKLASSRVESGDEGLKIVIENFDPVTGASEIIAEFPVVNEGYGWGHSISAYVSWTAKDQLFLHYLDNGYEKEKLIDLGSQPVEIIDVFTDLFGIEPPSIDPGLSLFGDTGTTGEEDYYLTIGTGFSPDGKVYLYSAKTGLVETYPLDSPKLLIIPAGDLLFGETYDETLEDMPLQIIQIGSDRPPYDLEINGEIPGQNKHGKVVLVDDDQHFLVASDQEISLIDIECGETIQTWVLENHDQYDDFLLSPSPDGRAVIIYGIQIDENEDWWRGHHRAIFLLNLDE